MKASLPFVLLWLLFGCATEIPATAEPTAPPLTATEVQHWRTDIDVFHQQLERRHIHLYHRIDRASFTTELAKLKASLPNLHRHQVMVEMMRITRLIGDGHTQFAWWYGDYYRYPVELMAFGSDWRIVKTAPAHAALLGGRLSAIDDIAIADIVSRLSPIVPGVENAHSLHSNLPYTLRVANVLYGLGITDRLDRARFTVVDDEGRQQVVTLSALNAEQYRAAVTMPLAQTPPFPGEPLLRTAGISLSLNRATKTGYIRFDSYPDWPEMERFAEASYQALQANTVRNLVIDLRHNGGGDFFKGLALARGLVLLDELDWREGIYTLIGRHTYSAAMSNAAQFRQLLNARLIGEPTGANPYGYQDADRFTLPHSGWPVQYSKRFYRFQDQPSEGIQPDQPIEIEWQHYKAGRDMQLQWVLDDIAGRQPARLSAEQTGTDTAVVSVRSR